MTPQMIIRAAGYQHIIYILHICYDIVGVVHVSIRGVVFQFVRVCYSIQDTNILNISFNLLVYVVLKVVCYAAFLEYDAICCALLRNTYIYAQPA